MAVNMTTVATAVANARTACSQVEAEFGAYADNSPSADAKAYHMRREVAEVRRALARMEELLRAADYSS
jgi:hypothetical protein